MLVKVALITALLGLAVLVVLSNTLEPKITPIGEITEKYLERFVKVRGNITDIKETEGLFILKIEDSSGEIKAIIYKSKQEPVLNEGSVELVGKVIEYKYQLEIEISELKTLR